MIAGERDPEALANLARRRLRSKIPALTEALTGRFTEHHAFLARVHLDLIDRHTQAVEEITDRIEVMIDPFQGFRQLICTIPGIGPGTADVIVAETGADMSWFPTGGHLASWAGTCPGSNESASRVKSTQTRPGTPACKARSAPRRWPARRTPPPTSARGTDGSPRAAAHRKRTSPSNTRCSPRQPV
jgi:transposase